MDQTVRDNPKTAIGSGTGVLGVAVNGGVMGGKRGETSSINLASPVLPPAADTQILVRETREILLNGSSVGKTSIEVSREGGTWKSTVPITLPAYGAPGNYRGIAAIESRDAGTGREETSFQVSQ